MPVRLVDRLRSVCVDHANLVSTFTRVTAARSTLAIVSLFDVPDVAPMVLAFEAQCAPFLWRTTPVLVEVPRAAKQWSRW
jgi:hypothetical protein